MADLRIRRNMPYSSILGVERMSDVFTAQKGRDKVTAALEEERRLVCVAVTRARDELIISSPSHYRGKKSAVWRFILEAFLQRSMSGAEAMQ